MGFAGGHCVLHAVWHHGCVVDGARLYRAGRNRGTAPPRRDATHAIFNLGLTILGAGLGPLAIGVLSDVLVPQFANEALRWALALSTALCYLLGMLAFASALRHYKAPAAT